jgi:uncharacterized protein (TIGR04255 family)
MPYKSEFLPDYLSPPVIETVLGVQFERPRGLTSAHLGAFWKTLDQSEWVSVSDAPPLAPQFEEFTKSARWSRGLHFTLTHDPAFRVQIRNRDKNRMIQVQNNRLHLNWLGQQDRAYRRYVQVKEEFVDILERFAAFVGNLPAQGEPGLRLTQWEVTYVNKILRGTVWQSPNEWSFFKPLNDMSDLPNVALGESFGGEWHFVIPERRGRLHVEWKHARDTDKSGQEEEHIRLTLTGRGPVIGDVQSVQSAIDGLDVGHEAIVRTFAGLMSPRANAYWGLKNGND